MIHLVKHIDRIRWATLTLLLEVSGPFGGATLLPDVLFMVEIVALHCFSWLMGVRLLFMMQTAVLCIGGVRVSRRCHGCGAWLHSNVSISL